jgi:hypothetical protein
VTYSDLVEKLRIALYQESQVEIELLGFEALVEKYGLTARSGLLAEAQRDLKSSGYIIGPDPVAGDETAFGQITGAGIRYIENKYGSKTGVGQILEPVVRNIVHELTANHVATGKPEGTIPTLGVFQSVEPTASTSSTFSESRGAIGYALPAGPITQTIDSAAWTGTQHVLIDQVVINKAKTHAQELKQLVYTIQIPNNAHSSDLKALVELLIQALEMCEPEVTLIDRILASPKFKVYTKLAGAVSVIRGAIGL